MSSLNSAPDLAADAVIRAAVGLLKTEGPAAIKTRRVASAAGVSTMALYTNFGSIGGLRRAVADYGFHNLDVAFGRAASAEDDPIAVVHALALVSREHARSNPHLYDLMFGLPSEPSADRPPVSMNRASGESVNYECAFGHIVEACQRLLDSGRIVDESAERIAGQVWALVHGVIALELAGHYRLSDDPAAEIMAPLIENYFVGRGDTRESALASQASGFRLFEEFMEALRP